MATNPSPPSSAENSLRSCSIALWGLSFPASTQAIRSGLSVRSAFPQLYEAEKAAGSIVRGMLRLAKSKRGPRERPTLQSFGKAAKPLCAR